MNTKLERTNVGGSPPKPSKALSTPIPLPVRRVLQARLADHKADESIIAASRSALWVEVAQAVEQRLEVIPRHVSNIQRIFDRALECIVGSFGFAKLEGSGCKPERIGAVRKRARLSEKIRFHPKENHFFPLSLKELTFSLRMDSAAVIGGRFWSLKGNRY